MVSLNKDTALRSQIIVLFDYCLVFFFLLFLKDRRFHTLQILKEKGEKHDTNFLALLQKTSFF